MISKLKTKIFHTNVVMSTLYYLRNTKPRLRIMSSEQSIDYIEKTDCSVARFGEGRRSLGISGIIGGKETISVSVLQI